MRTLLALLALSAAALHAQPTLPNAVPMPTPQIQYLDRTGKPLVGAKLCTYAAGTSTPLVTYTDSTAGTPNTNPVVLDVNGQASIWIGPQLYKFVLRTGGDGTCSTGAVQWTQDNVADTTLYFANSIKTAGTCTAVSFIATATGSVMRTCSSKLNDSVSLKDFGAVGDGVTDDTAAIQLAANWMHLNATSGHGVSCPAGKYVITSTVVLSNVSGGVLRGDGQACVFLWQGGTGGPMFDLQNVAESVFTTFAINVTPGNHLTEGFRMSAVTGATVFWRHNQFNQVWVDGGNGGNLDYGFRGFIGSGGDANGDFMLFENVRVTHYLQSAWSIEGTQFHGWRMENCWAVGSDGGGAKLGKYAVSGGVVGGVDRGARANYFWHGGFVGFHSVADFFNSQPPSPALTTTYADFGSEGSNRFLLVGTGINGNGTRTIIDNVRWSELGLNADGKFMILYGCGPFFIRNSMFGEAVGGDGTAVPMSMLWNYGLGNFAPYMEITGSAVMTSNTTYAQIFNIGTGGAAPNYVWGTVAQQTQEAYTVLDSIRTVTALDGTFNSFMDPAGFHPGTADGDKAVPFISGAGGPLRTGHLTWDNTNYLLNMHANGASPGFGPNLLTYYDSGTGLGFGLGSQASTFQVMAATSGNEIDLGYGLSDSFTPMTRFPMGGLGGVQLRSTGNATGGGCDTSAAAGKFVYAAGAAGVKDQVLVCAKDAADHWAWRTIY